MRRFCGAKRAFATPNTGAQKMKKFAAIFLLFACGAAFAWVAPDVKKLVDADQVIKDGGGRAFFIGGGCLVVGVGAAQIKDFESARKLATQRAEAEVLKAVSFTDVEVSGSSESKTIANKNNTQIEDKSVSKYKARVSGSLSNLKIRGYEIQGGVFYSIVCAYVDLPAPECACSAPGLLGARAEKNFGGIAQKLQDIYLGGAKLVEFNGAIYAAAVASAKSSLRPDAAERLMEMNASKEILKFLKGFSLKEEISARSEISRIIKNGEEFNSYDEKIKEFSRSELAGILSNVELAATFKNDISGRPSAVYVLKISN